VIGRTTVSTCRCTHLPLGALGPGAAGMAGGWLCRAASSHAEISAHLLAPARPGTAARENNGPKQIIYDRLIR
jgi:hypothetical protein